MNIFKFVMKSRGPVNLGRRAFQVASRFGPTPARMEKRFERFMDVLDRHGCRPTFPITALPMNRNPRLAHRLLERGAELAVHAYTHTDLTTLSRDQQSRHIGKAVGLFRKHGIPFAGFRAPYLHWNEDTMAVVESYRFRYSSNEIVLWDVVDRRPLKPLQRDGWEKAVRFYKPRDAETTLVLPSRRRGFVEIPVSLPDDEILYDRMYLHSVDTLADAWQAILENTYRRGELFTVQLHPERIDYFSQALEGLLSSCRRKNPGVWVATLDEIADWWVAKSQNTAEFVRENSAYRATIKSCKGAVVYLREDGRERPIEPGEIRIDGGLRPCAGVSPGSERRAVQLLQDMGYILEVGEPAEKFAVHLGKLAGAEFSALRGLIERLERFEGPLLRFGAWPHGNRSALALTGDIDSITIWDFLHRLRGA